MKKKNDKIRVSTDFSTRLNDSLQNYNYPLPSPEEYFGKLSRNPPSGAPYHSVSDVLPKLIKCFASFNIIHFHKVDPASVDQPSACSQEPTYSKTNHQRKREK